MHELRDQCGVAFLVASHDPRVLERVDRVVTIRDGQVVDDSPAGAVRTGRRTAGALAAAGRA
jgi:ABC-type lipoprotein export system ATPase subunit